MSAAPSALKGQCQPVVGSSEARSPEPRNTAPGKPPAGKPDAGSPEFYDEPKFTVAGVTDTTNLGGHGSAVVQRNAEALARFGVAWQAQGANDRALRCLFDASDLNPSDPTPYLFLGKMQNTEIVHAAGFAEKMKRFARLQPENALANYYYATTLWKRANNSVDAPAVAQIESLLQRAVRLDPKLGVGYLQLGILYAARRDFPTAIAAYQQASEVSPELEETHYRLADAYRRVGEKTKAQRELQLYSQLSKKNTEQAERERHEIQQFVFALRDQSPATNSSPEHQ